MGRLQRKKQSSQKKKKKQDDGTPVGESTSPVAVDQKKKDAGKGVSKPAVLTGRKPAPAAKPAAAKTRDNWLTRSIQFLREVKVELKKVTWPSRKQTVGSTVVVIILVTIISFFLGAVDIGLSSLVKLVLQ